MSAAGSRKKRKNSKNLGVILLCLVLAFASVGLIAVGVWKMLIVPPDMGEKVPSNTPVETPEEHPDEENSESVESEPVNARKEDFYTFLLLGKDTGGGGNTDTMILASYDVKNASVDLMTIPRDTMINVPWNIKKINAVYASSRGIDGLKTEIGHLTSVVPDFYIAVEWEAIGEIVDALGGVWFDVPYTMDYDDPYQDLHIHQEKGYRLLDGSDAMQVIRWRSNNDDSPHGYHREDGGVGDTGRQKIQKNFLKALAQQCLQIGNWTKVSAFAEIFFKNVETDIPWNNLIWFAQQAMSLDVENITFYSMPGNDEGWYYTPSLGVNLAYFFADPDGIVELVNERFNPYTQDITVDDLQIVFKNSDASLGVTSGELADPQMAIPSVKPPSQPKTDKNETDEPEDGGDTEGEGTLPAEDDEQLPPEEQETPPDEEDPSNDTSGTDEETAQQSPAPEEGDEPVIEDDSSETDTNSDDTNG